MSAWIATENDTAHKEKILVGCIIFVASRKKSEAFAFLLLIDCRLALVKIDDFEHHDRAFRDVGGKHRGEPCDNLVHVIEAYIGQLRHVLPIVIGRSIDHVAVREPEMLFPPLLLTGRSLA